LHKGVLLESGKKRYYTGNICDITCVNKRK